MIIYNEHVRSVSNGEQAKLKLLLMVMFMLTWRIGALQKEAKLLPKIMSPSMLTIIS